MQSCILHDWNTVTFLSFFKLFEVPDGHRAPIPHLSSKCGFQIGSSCVASHSSSSSSTSFSPQRPLDLEPGRSFILFSGRQQVPRGPKKCPRP